MDPFLEPIRRIVHPRIRSKFTNSCTYLFSHLNTMFPSKSSILQEVCNSLSWGPAYRKFEFLLPNHLDFQNLIEMKSVSFKT